MKTTKLSVVVNQAGLHLMMKISSPSANWLDKAKKIGYYPRLTAYLKDLEKARENYKVSKFTNMKQLVTALEEVKNNGKIPILGKRRGHMKGGMALVDYIKTLSNE